MGKSKEIQANTDALLEREDLKCKLRAKVHWLQNGNRNIKLFHLYTNQRKKANHICEVKDAARVNCHSPEEISRAFLEYFQSIFSSWGFIGEDGCLEVLEGRFKLEMNE